MNTRRQFLRHATLGATTATLLPALLKASADSLPATTKPLTGIIDWHNHWISPTEIRLLGQRAKAPRITTGGNGEKLLERVTDATGSAAQPFPIWPAATDIEARIKHLDENGVARQIISYTVPFGYDASLSAEEIKPLFRGFNDDLAALVQKHPTRFIGLAALPTSDLAWAAEELQRAHQELGFIGASLPLNAFATLRGARVLAPIFEVAQKNRSHIFVHRGAASPGIPGQPPVLLPEDTEWARGSLISDSQLAAGAITLGLTDFLDPYPDITVQIVMLGGAIPYVIEHIQSGAKRAGVGDPVEKFRRLFLDPGPYSTSPRSVLAAVQAFGADRILFGSDFGPMPNISAGITTLNAALTDEQRQLVYVENGRALLKAKGRRA
jgi:predicted TIM-barrel fold metal-dependent hydrolase